METVVRGAAGGCTEEEEEDAVCEETEGGENTDGCLAVVEALLLLVTVVAVVILAVILAAVAWMGLNVESIIGDKAERRVDDSATGSAVFGREAGVSVLRGLRASWRIVSKLRIRLSRPHKYPRSGPHKSSSSCCNRMSRTLRSHSGLPVVAVVVVVMVVAVDVVVVVVVATVVGSALPPVVPVIEEARPPAVSCPANEEVDDMDDEDDPCSFQNCLKIEWWCDRVML